MAIHVYEADEAFTVHLSNASGATISDADGTGTIVNDDAAPSFAIDDVTHSEGNAGTTVVCLHRDQDRQHRVERVSRLPDRGWNSDRGGQRLPGEQRNADLRGQRDDQDRSRCWSMAIRRTKRMKRSRFI